MPGNISLLIYYLFSKCFWLSLHICEIQNHFAKFSNIVLDFNWYFIKFTHLGEMDSFILLNLLLRNMIYQRLSHCTTPGGLYYSGVMKYSACVAIGVEGVVLHLPVKYYIFCHVHLLSCTSLIMITSRSFIFLLLLWVGSFYPLDFLLCLLQMNFFKRR